MGDSHTQLGSNGSAAVSDDSIRRFLLGQLTAGEQTDFEERLFTDAELEARVRLAEFDLSDDYAYARLGTAERELFRQRFLLTSDRHQQLKVSRALHDRFAAQSPSDSYAIRQTPGTFLDLRQPAWRYAFAAAILILVFATVLLVTKEPQIVRRLVPERIIPRPKMTPTPQVMHHPGAQSSPVHAEQSPAMPAHEVPAMTVVLDPNMSADQARPLSLPGDDTAVVRFQLPIQTDRSNSYRADLFTMAGEAVFRAESLKPPDTNPTTIYFDVPRKVLKGGQYQITLIRVDGGSTLKSGDYYFHIR
jgi:hypothetical protein